MKGVTAFLTSVVLVTFLGCGQTKVLPPHLSSQAANEWPAEEHRIAADLFEEEAIQLVAKVAHLDQRVERFTKKSYLDPKGFKRQGWERLIRGYRKEIPEIREQMACHHGEADRFDAMPPSDDIKKRKEGKKG